MERKVVPDVHVDGQSKQLGTSACRAADSFSVLNSRGKELPLQGIRLDNRVARLPCVARQSFIPPKSRHRL